MNGPDVERCVFIQVVAICRIPDDYIDNKRHPLFIARQVLRTLIKPLQP
jgi:hypothetical protein